MNMNSYSFMLCVFWIAVGFWFIATVAIRVAGRLPLPQDRGQSLSLYVASFSAMAALIPALLRAVSVPKASWFAAVTVLMLPTLALDPLSCLFFEKVFPKSDARAVATFGGWVLISCVGAVVGVWVAQ